MRWGSYIFVHMKKGWLHKIVQPFLRGYVFLGIPISIPKEIALKESATSQIILLFILKVMIQNPSENYQIWEQGYLLFAFNSLVSFYFSCTKTVSLVKGSSSYFMCILEGGPHYVMQWQEQVHGKLCIGKLKCTSPPLLL